MEEAVIIKYMQLHITQVTNHDKKKDNTPMLDSKGRQKYRSVIKTNEYGDQFLSGFVFRPLTVGEVIEADVTTEEYMGKPQLKFALIPSGKQVEAAVQNDSAIITELKNQTILLKAILDKSEGIYMSISTHQTIEALKKPKALVVPDSTGTAFDDVPQAQEVKGADDYGLESEFPS